MPVKSKSNGQARRYTLPGISAGVKVCPSGVKKSVQRAPVPGSLPAAKYRVIGLALKHGRATAGSIAVSFNELLRAGEKIRFYRGQPGVRRVGR